MHRTTARNPKRRNATFWAPVIRIRDLSQMGVVAGQGGGVASILPGTELSWSRKGIGGKAVPPLGSEVAGGVAPGLLEVGDKPAVADDRDSAGGLRDAEGNRGGRRRDPGGGLVAGAETGRQGLKRLVLGDQVTRGAEDHAVAADHEGTVDGGELLDRLLQ